MSGLCKGGGSALLGELAAFGCKRVNRRDRRSKRNVEGMEKEKRRHEAEGKKVQVRELDLLGFTKYVIIFKLGNVDRVD